MDQLRAAIDDVDERLIKLLAERFAVTRRVGYLKAEQGMAPIDADREAEIEAKSRRLAEENGLDSDLVTDVLRSVIDRVVAEHQSIAANSRN